MQDAVETRAETREKWMAAIIRTLQELSPVERGVFTLSRYYANSLAEISQKMCLPIQEIEQSLRSANAKLERNLKYFRDAIV